MSIENLHLKLMFLTSVDTLSLSFKVTHFLLTFLQNLHLKGFSLVWIRS
jgi:hypothetical protein